MANKIILKKSSVPAKVPLVADLDYGELALNYADGKLYFKDSSNVIGTIGGSGSSSTPVVTTVTASTTSPTAISGTQVIFCNTTSNSITVNLPTAVSNNCMYIIKKIAAANSMVIDPSGTETIDDSTTTTITVENTCLTLLSDGTNWRII